MVHQQAAKDGRVLDWPGDYLVLISYRSVILPMHLLSSVPFAAQTNCDLCVNAEILD
jgi:hypothetical protein